MLWIYIDRPRLLCPGDVTRKELCVSFLRWTLTLCETSRETYHP